MTRTVVALALLALARVAAADCRSGPELVGLARSIVGAFRCERARLAITGTTCTPPPAPACAGAVVGRLLELGGTPGLTLGPGDRRALTRALRCQRSLARAVAVFAIDRIRSAALGIRGREADARAARRLRHVGPRCAVAVGTTSGGVRVPRAGAPCDTATAGERVDAAGLVECLRTTLVAGLEPALRSSIKPSFVLILTDDQPASMVDRMDALRTDLVTDRGVSFGRATSTTPMCAPARASLLSGRYAHEHRVVSNFSPYGFFAFDDSSTVATWLRNAGYRTGLFGKYLNGYTGGPPTADYDGPLPYVPPGWSDWSPFTSYDFFDYRLLEDGVARSYGSAEADYSTDVLAAKAVDFIRTSGDRPFLLVFAPYAPHDPATPAPRHVGRFAGIPPWRPLDWNEADVSDKARWMRGWVDPLSPELTAFADELYPKMLESLLAVDDAIDAIMQALREAGRDEDTMVVFTSDNGFSLGEHRWVGKVCPYEECLKIPLVVRYPRLVRSARQDDRAVANIDLAPTFAEFAGAAPGGPVAGTSLAPLLDGSAATWRSDVLAEGWSIIPTSYRAVRTERYSYIEYSLVPPLQGQEAELYDLALDPFELTSVHADPTYQAVKSALAARVRELDPGWTQTPP